MAHKSWFKHDMTPVSVERYERKAKKQERLDAAYALVNKRDGHKCRCTGEPLAWPCPDAKHRREHHHLRGRNVAPERREDPQGICLVSAFVHKLITKGWIDVEGDNADGALRFHYTALAKSRPVRIKSRRKSQQRAA